MSAKSQNVNLVEVKNLKSVGEDGSFLNMVSLTVPNKDGFREVRIQGQTGSGKSPLFDCLAGRRRAKAGSVKLYDGLDPVEEAEQVWQQTAYIPEREVYPPRLTIENLIRTGESLLSKMAR